MTENLKKFMAELHKNEEIRKKCDGIIDEIHVIVQKGQEVTPDMLEPLIKIAGELGLELDASDFKPLKTELTDDDLEAVAGGQEHTIIGQLNSPCTKITEEEYPHWLYCRGVFVSCEHHGVHSSGNVIRAYWKCHKNQWRKPYTDTY